VQTESCFKCDAHRQNPMEVSTSVVWLVVMTVKITRAREGAVPLFACHSGSCWMRVWQEADLRTKCLFTASVFPSNFCLF
jgi:hypothetical protein